MKKKIAILFGGCSEEHDISVKSAIEIGKNLNKDKYEPIFIGITKEGNWKLCKEPTEKWELEDCLDAFISPDRSHHGIIVIENGGYRIIHIDVVFPIMHGKMGEDGQIQGFLEIAGIPYVGCGIQASMLAMDKSLTYQQVRKVGILTPNFQVLQSGEYIDETKLCYPVFVKPARSGSSFGVNKVMSNMELNKAVEEASIYDTKVLIEEAISGSEIGCAVLGNGNELILGEVDMINLSHGFFRIHQEQSPEKGSENASIVVPAELSKELSDHIKETAKRIYLALGCRGLARVDLFLRSDGVVVLNEVNTMPGCTSYSRYPRMMKAAGISMTQVIDKLIDIALQG